MYSKDWCENMILEVDKYRFIEYYNYINIG